MIAGTAVVARIAAWQGSFLVSEHRSHGGVHVDRNAVGALRPKLPHPMIGNDGFKRLDLVGTEPTKIVVECVDAGDRAAGQMLEKWVRGEPLEVEDAPRSDDGGVKQQLHLGVHGVDNLLARLEVTEVARQPPPKSLALNERIEVDQSANARQRSIVPPALQLTDIGPANSTAFILPFPARCLLASQRRPPHLLGARRV